MESRKLKILLILTVFSLFIPFLARAGILPCGPFTQKPNCEPCDLLVLFVNVVEFLLFKLIPILAAVVLGYGAFTFVIGLLQQSSEVVNKGKRWLLSVFIGFVIIYGGWILVDLFLRLMGFTQEKWPGLKGAWWRIDIECAIQSEIVKPSPEEKPKPSPEEKKPPEKEKCVKIAGNGPLRIVLVPSNNNSKLPEDFEPFRDCKKEWTKKEIEDGTWEKIANRFISNLNADHFTKDNFSLYRYDEISTDLGTYCNALKTVYIIKCSYKEYPIQTSHGIAYAGGGTLLGFDYIVLTRDVLDLFQYALAHELGHAVGRLYDEYVLFFNLEEAFKKYPATKIYFDEGPRNCVFISSDDECPSWWKDYGASCYQGCNGVVEGFYRDDMRDIMSSKGSHFGPIDKFYLYQKLGLDTEKLKVKK
jgi:hypothetical protein